MPIKVVVKKIISVQPQEKPKEPEIEKEEIPSHLAGEWNTPTPESSEERLARLQREFKEEMSKKLDPQHDAEAPAPSREWKTEWQKLIAGKFPHAKIRYVGAKEIYVDDDKKEFHLHINNVMLYYSISAVFGEAVVEMNGVRRDKLIAAVDYCCVGKKFF